MDIRNTLYIFDTMEQKVQEALRTLKSETMKENCPPAIMDLFQPKFVMNIGAEGEFDHISQVLKTYFIVKAVNNTISKVPRRQLVMALTIYFMHGSMDKKARRLAEKTLNISEKALNSLNLELRDLKIIVKDEMSRTGQADLSDELKMLRDHYYKHKNEGNKLSFLIEIKNEKA